MCACGACFQEWQPGAGVGLCPTCAKCDDGANDDVDGEEEAVAAVVLHADAEVLLHADSSHVGGKLLRPGTEVDFNQRFAAAVARADGKLPSFFDLVRRDTGPSLL